MKKRSAGLEFDATAAKSRLLLIDDDGEIVEILGDLLSRQFEVVAETDARCALARLEREHFDAVITDMRMPNMNGGDVIDAVRSLAEGTPIIVISGHIKTEREIADAMARGATLLVPKPLPTWETFVASIVDVIRNAEAKLQKTG